jgi:hypothetical protein
MREGVVTDLEQDRPSSVHHSTVSPGGMLRQEGIGPNVQNLLILVDFIWTAVTKRVCASTPTIYYIEVAF